MTENKRFIYAKSEGEIGYAIYDTTKNYTEKNYTFPNFPREYEAKVLCRVLNELHEENEKLTKQLVDYKILVNDLSIQRDEFFNGARENAELNGKLQKENEQLRLQMLRLYNYFEDNLKEEMNPTVFSEMWDIVKRELKSYMGD